MFPISRLPHRAAFDNATPLLLEAIPETQVEYVSIDATVETDEAVNFPVERIFRGLIVSLGHRPERFLRTFRGGKQRAMYDSATLSEILLIWET